MQHQQPPPQQPLQQHVQQHVPPMPRNAKMPIANLDAQLKESKTQLESATTRVDTQQGALTAKDEEDTDASSPNTFTGRSASLEGEERNEEDHAEDAHSYSWPRTRMRLGLPPCRRRSTWLGT